MLEKTFSRSVLAMDAQQELSTVIEFIQSAVQKQFKRKGVVVGLSGGLDSSVTAAASVMALGRDRVVGLFLPEKESNPESLVYAENLAGILGIETVKIDITGNLESFHLYEERDEVIRRLFPEFDETWRFHVTLPQNLLEKDRINVHYLTVMDPKGRQESKRLTAGQWHEIASRQNIKQRVRMIQLYRMADMLNYIVAGTTNRSETEQGFFVKFGDGGVDIEPISHLYKTQVYELAKILEIPPEIIDRDPSPDTYSLPVSDREFYFCLDYEMLDLLLYAYSHGIPAERTAAALGLTFDQVKRIFKDFTAKENNTWHLRQMPLAAGENDAGSSLP